MPYELTRHNKDKQQQSCQKLLAVSDCRELIYKEYQKSNQVIHMDTYCEMLNKVK